MKKSLLFITMSMVMGGLIAAPKTVIATRAEEKLLTPDQASLHAPHAPYFEEGGNFRYAWEYLNDSYLDIGPTIKDMASLEVAFFPTNEGFNEEKAYATVTHTTPAVMSSSSILNALKSVWATPDIPYSPAMRYISKIEDYSNSDWYVLENVSFTYEFDYALNNYGNISVDGSGRLVWPWEIFTSNPEGDQVDHIEVLVFAGSTMSIDEDSVPLTTFNVYYEDKFTYKADVERNLTLANLKPGEYKFSARLIPVNGSKYEKSHLYPLTGAYPYEPEDLGTTNIAKGSTAYAPYGNASAVVDGNRNSRWINGVGDNKTETGWLLIDLGTKYHLSTLKIFWEGAYAKDFDVFLEKNIDVESFDGNTAGMKPVASVRERTSYLEEDEFSVAGNSGRYIIVSLLARGSGYDYSIYEVEAYVDTEVSEAEKFIDDWKDLRAMGNGNICDVIETDEMARMIAWYDKLSSEDKAIVDETADAQGNSIGSSVEFIKALLESREEANNGQTTAGLLLTIAKENKYTVATVAGLIIMTFAGYIILNKKKKLAK